MVCFHIGALETVPSLGGFNTASANGFTPCSGLGDYVHLRDSHWGELGYQLLQRLGQDGVQSM
jgi:hypothetical protein